MNESGQYKNVTLIWGILRIRPSGSYRQLACVVVSTIEKDLETASWLSQDAVAVAVGFGFFLPLPLPFAVYLILLETGWNIEIITICTSYPVPGYWRAATFKSYTITTTAAAKQICPEMRCRLNGYSRSYYSTPAPAGAPSTRTLPGCVPVHLAASLCWRPLFEWHLNLCIHPNLVRLIVRSAGAAICCCSVSPDRTSHSIGDGIMRWLHYALAARARPAAADATRINKELDFEYVYSKLENWISSSCKWNWNFCLGIWIITI